MMIVCEKGSVSVPLDDYSGCVRVADACRHRVCDLEERYQSFENFLRAVHSHEALTHSHPEHALQDAVMWA